MIVNSGDFSGDAVVKTPCFHCRGHRFNPWSDTKIPHAVQHCEKINILLKLFFFFKKRANSALNIQSSVWHAND